MNSAVILSVLGEASVEITMFSTSEIDGVGLYSSLLTQHCYGENENISQVNNCIWYCYDSETLSTVGHSVLPTLFQEAMQCNSISVKLLFCCTHHSLLWDVNFIPAHGSAWNPSTTGKWFQWCDVKRTEDLNTQIYLFLVKKISHYFNVQSISSEHLIYQNIVAVYESTPLYIIW